MRSILISVATLLVCTLAATACTTEVDGTGPGSGSGNASDVSATTTTSGDPCRPAAGTYSIHYVKAPDSASACVNLADDTTTLTDLSVDGGSGSFLAHARAAGCTVTPNSATCVYAIHCDSTTDGVRVISDSTLNTTTPNPSGESQVSSSTGAVCKYSIQYTHE